MTTPLHFGTTSILLATGNPAKQETLRWLLEGLPLHPVTPRELGIESVPDEEGDTHEDIARLKAAEWSRASSMLVIASDGGLLIPALGINWESRFTHRFAGLDADDSDRTRQLLELMRPYKDEERQASWVEAVAIADRGQVLASWELTGSTGIIQEVPGNAPQVPGFWVFSLWYFPRFGKTYRELTSQEKAELDDHWTRLKELVQRFFKTRL
ncbi:MAG TPA: non-canonical purine NTP pyrophosphatase [Dehalococcoidia bacterium]|jgi:XTP/dITP diphosphohydrolase|nr:non-canonical purine NTP pyrophosphatase [Dehalococcoidia bacterium]